MICWAIYYDKKIIITSIRTTKRECTNSYLKNWGDKLAEWETCQKVIVKKWEGK